jgi:hypothetical protein
VVKDTIQPLILEYSIAFVQHFHCRRCVAFIIAAHDWMPLKLLIGVIFEVLNGIVTKDEGIMIF